MAIVEPEDGKSYGIAAVTNWVDGDNFPVSKSALDEAFGEQDVMLAHDHAVEFREILSLVEDEEFERPEELWQALGVALREIDGRRQRYRPGA